MALVWKESSDMGIDSEIERIADLASKLRVIPESQTYGTAHCRSFIIAQTGEYVDRSLPGRHPLTIEWAHKITQMTAGSRWDEEKAFDKHPNVIVELFKRVSDPWVYPFTHDKLWDYGVVLARSYDNRGRMHYPQTSTVYPDDDSVLRDIATVLGCVVLEKLSYKAWVKFSPTSWLSDEQLLQDSARFIAEESKRILGDRFVITPGVFLTPQDIESGRSWTFKHRLYATKSRDTVYTDVKTYRMSDL